MPKPNYSFEKRQRELAKKKKQEEKRQRKVSRTDSPGQVDGGAEPDQGGADAARPPTGDPRP